MPFPRHTLADADALVAAAGFASTTVTAAERCIDCRRYTRRAIVGGPFYCSAPMHVRRAIAVAEAGQRIMRERAAALDALPTDDEPVEYLPEATATITGSGAYVPDADEVDAIAARYGIPADSIESNPVETLLDEVEARADAEHAAGLVHLLSDDLLDACGTAAPGGLTLAPFTTPEAITCPACSRLAEEERRRVVEVDHDAALIADAILDARPALAVLRPGVTDADGPAELEARPLTAEERARFRAGADLAFARLRALVPEPGPEVDDPREQPRSVEWSEVPAPRATLRAAAARARARRS